MLALNKIVAASCIQKLLPASSTISVIRHNSDISFLKDINPAQFKKGPGGRSSFSGKLVTIFGASSFLGLHLVSHLAKSGTQVVLPYRDFFELKKCKTMGDLGQILFIEFSLHDELSIRKAVMYSDAVINVIGRHHNHVSNMLQKVNVEAPRALARICREMGVPHLIHVSALNCNIEQKGYFKKNGSEFLRSKYQGELGVLDEFPTATIIRPSDMFGDGDIFLQRILAPYRKHIMQDLYVPHRGKGVYKQPVSVLNVAQALTFAALNERITAGKIYEAVGPRRYEFYDLLNYFLRVTRRDSFGKIKDSRNSNWIRFKMWANEHLIIENFSRDLFNTEVVEREAVSDTTCGLPTIKDFGIRLIPIEEVAMFILKHFVYGRPNSMHIDEAFVEAPAKYTEPPM